MAQKCDHCGKGINYGHAVSHAKNRLPRIFKPNLQKLKVLKNGVLLRMRFCTSCIKRLKKDGKIGIYKIRRFDRKPLIQPTRVKKEQIVKEKDKIKEKEIKDKAKKEEDERETLKIEAIVGKKS